MSQAPLPPHERTWRHPSELAAAERDAVRAAVPPSSTRMFALATGSFGLLAIGLLVMSIAPDRRDGPIAISATTTADIDTTLRSSGVAAIGRFASDGSGSDDWSVRMEPALATPIGDGRSALATLQGVRRTEGAIDVRLSSGSVVSAAVMDHTDDGLVVVTIAASDAAHTVGDGPPDDDEIVTVLTEPPITVPFHEVDDLELAEGTPVLDSEGHLIGLCTRAGGQRAVLDVTGHPDDDRAGSTTTEPEPSTPVTTVAVASSGPGPGAGSGTDTAPVTSGVDDATSVAPPSP